MEIEKVLFFVYDNEEIVDSIVDRWSPDNFTELLEPIVHRGQEDEDFAIYTSIELGFKTPITNPAHILVFVEWALKEDLKVEFYQYQHGDTPETRIAITYDKETW